MQDLHEDKFKVRELKWTVGNLEKDKQPRPDSFTKVYKIHITGDEPSPTKREKPAAFLSALQILKAPYGRQDKMVATNLESSDDDDEGDEGDIQHKNVPQRKEDQVSYQGFKQLERRFYKKLKNVEDQMKDLNVSERIHSACDINKDVQKPRTCLVLPGRACDVAQYVPLESSSFPTEEAGDVRKIHKRVPFPRGLPSLTKAISRIFSKTRAQAEKPAARQRIYPLYEE